MRKILFLISLVLLGVVSAKAAPEVPSKMSYCGIEVHLDDSARSYMSNIVRQITRSPNYFKSLVTKVDMYMPFVEEAFQYAEVPQDLKYIVIMESSLQSDVVSSSNAVGFWQFKEASAREVGLVMNGQVDERMHIFRSSVGAARYFYRLNRDFDNWLYAVIAYNRGPAGAIPYVDPKYFGKKSMEVTGKTHGYGLKALAYKLIFQDELGKGMPTEWLEPRPTLGETSIDALAESNRIDVETLKKYNRWIRGNSLPAQRDLVVYVPRQGAPVVALMRHPHEGLDRPQVGGPDPVRQADPVVKPNPPKNSKKYTYLSDLEDPDFGIEYVRAKGGQNLVEIAVLHGFSTKKIKEYNGFDNAHRVEEGEIVYLKSIKKQRFHIVKAGETLEGIANRHGMELAKLKAKNRMVDAAIVPGQKLYLKKSKPKTEKPLLLESSVVEVATVPQPVVVQPKPKPDSPNPTPTPKPQPAAGKTHTVASGETLFGIARKYGTSVEAIKSSNQLRSDTLYVGQKLRIPQ